VQPDFLYSVSRDFIRNCSTPMLVLPDDVPGHPLQTSIDVASLAPNAEITVFPWKEPEELKTTHDRPGAPLLKSTHPDARRGAVVGRFHQLVVRAKAGRGGGAPSVSPVSPLARRLRTE
jgi:hypothetical protein